MKWSEPLVSRLRSASKLRIAALATAGLLALLLVVLVVYSSVELARFARVEARRATFVYAAPQALAPGVHVRRLDLAGTLARLKYAESPGAPSAPGQYRRVSGVWDIHLRGGFGTPPQRVRVEVRDERIARVTRDGHNVGAVTLEPEVLTSGDDRRGEQHRPVRLADVPLTLLNAVLAAEDHRFFEHSGLDARGLLRAAWTNVRAGRVLQGGSTITQQLVKNRLLGSRRTFGRKLNEAWLATLVEWRYGKPQILEAYLNEVYLGQRGGFAVRGVGAAARAYFRKEIHQLTPAEAALLAGMLRAPNSYSPAVDPARARARRDVVLTRMKDLGMLSPADWQSARAQAVSPVPAVTVTAQTAPYFADYVRLELEHRYGSNVAASAGMVHTTLDLGLQRFAEAALVRGLDRIETRWPRLGRREPARRLQAALVALDPATGEIRAFVGGRDYQVSQFNRAALAQRQPGSAFKPFVFLAALRQREGPPALTAASLVDDTPIVVTIGRETWTPRNYGDHYEGRVTVRRALEASLNAATIRVAESVGMPAVVDTARALGLEGELAPVPAAALGAFEVTPLALARAYLPLANAGVRPSAALAVRAVHDRDGPIEPAESAQPAAVITPAEAYLITSLLEGVVRSGTGAGARSLVSGPIAGKTGTTNDGRDAWFVGYAPRLLAVVWVGFDDGEPHGLSGADAALPIWADFMRQALEAYPEPDFAVPGGVAFADVDQGNGRLANKYCPVVARETFLMGTEPAPCQEHGGVADKITDWWRRLRDFFGR